MTARLILPADAPRDQWLAARRGGVTASEIAVILGISPYDSPFNLYYRKRGELTDDYDNTAMSLGRHLEPWIADQWAADHPEWTVGTGGLYASEERSWQMATPDRLLYDGLCRCPDFADVADDHADSLLEIKSSGTYDGWGDDGTDVIPAYYRAQVLWQLDVMGLAEAHVTCFFLSTRNRRDYVVAYDADDVQLMRKAAHAFMDAVEAGTPPDIDWHPATEAALKALNPKVDDDETEIAAALADRYATACQRFALWKRIKKQVENELRDAMGPHKRATAGGLTVATRSIYTVPEHTRPESHMDKLTPPRSKK